MDTPVSYPESAFSPPRFERVEDEREYRKQRLVGAFRIFSKFGFEEGLAGHITARDPELIDHFWVNPVAQPFGFMQLRDLVLVDSNGRVVEGTGPINGAAFAIHSQIHEAWPEVVSAAHSHSVYGRAWSALGRRLDPITQDACLFYNRHALFDDYTGAVLSLEEGKRIAHTLRPGDKALILRNHGLLSVGASVEEATWNYVAFERCCQVQLLAEAAGTPTLIRADIAEEQATLVSDIGWASFQPLWRKVLREQPDLLN